MPNIGWMWLPRSLMRDKATIKRWTGGGVLVRLPTNALSALPPIIARLQAEGRNFVYESGGDVLPERLSLDRAGSQSQAPVMRRPDA